MTAAVRFVLRLPFVVCMVVGAPMIWVISFAHGETPRAAAIEAWGFIRDTSTGRMP